MFTNKFIKTIGLLYEYQIADTTFWLKAVNTFRGNDAYAAAKDVRASRDVGVAPTTGFHFPG